MLHFNARSLRSSYSEIQDLLRKVKVKFDMIAIGETWLSKDSTTLYTFDDYDAFHVVRDNRKGGGVVIYVNKMLNGRLCETKSVMVLVLECVTIEYEINRNKTAMVSCVYRYPGSYIISFNYNIEQLFSHIRYTKTLYICGDFNIDLLKSDNHNGTKEYLDVLYSLGVYSIINPRPFVVEIMYVRNH